MVLTLPGRISDFSVRLTEATISLEVAAAGAGGVLPGQQRHLEYPGADQSGNDGQGYGEDCAGADLARTNRYEEMVSVARYFSLCSHWACPRWAWRQAAARAFVRLVEGSARSCERSLSVPCAPLRVLHSSHLLKSQSTHETGP